MSKAISVVASVTQQSRQRVPQSWTEYRERPKATWVQTARRADDQQRSVQCRWRLYAISETGTQSAARYRGAVLMRQRWVKMIIILDALSHVKPVEVARFHASAASSHGQTSSYQSEHGLLHSSRHTITCNSAVTLGRLATTKNDRR